MNAPSIGSIGKARPASGGREMGLATLIGFFALAFGLSWGIVALLLLFPGQIEKGDESRSFVDSPLVPAS